MGQVIALCTSDETDDHGYSKSTVEKVRARSETEATQPDHTSFSLWVLRGSWTFLVAWRGAIMALVIFLF